MSPFVPASFTMTELTDFIIKTEGFSQSRLTSLYADFARDAKIDPDSFVANLEDWQKALYHAAKAGKIPSSAGEAADKSPRSATENKAQIAHPPRDRLTIQTGEPLLRALELPVLGRPDSLGAVLQDAINQKQLVPANEYLAAKESIYAKSWLTIPTPWQVVAWGLKQIGLVNPATGHTVKVGKLVCVENLEAAASVVIAQHGVGRETLTSRIYSMQTFGERFSNAFDSPLTASDLQMLVMFLSRDKEFLAYDAKTNTIKFGTSMSSPPDRITENDVGIAQINTLRQSLIAAVPDLEERVTALDGMARDAVARKELTKARNALRRKRPIENALQQRYTHLAQLEELLESIDTAHDSAAMVKAMASSTAVLRDLNSKIGSIESVDKVVDKLREEMDKTEDISNAINEVNQSSSIVDESEVDEEFEVMRQQQAAKEAREQAQPPKNEAEEQKLWALYAGQLGVLETQNQQRLQALIDETVEKQRLAAETMKQDRADAGLQDRIERLKALQIPLDIVEMSKNEKEPAGQEQAPAT